MCTFFSRCSKKQSFQGFLGKNAVAGEMDCDCKKSCQNWLGNVAVAKLKQLNWQITKPLETQKMPLMSKTWFSEKKAEKKYH